MPRSEGCSLAQVAIEALIAAYGIRSINKKSHHEVRDLAIQRIVHVLEEYKILVDLADRKEAKDDVRS